MSSLQFEVKKLAVLTLRGKEKLNIDDIRRHIGAAVKMQRDLGRTEEVDEDAILREVLSQVSTWQADPSVLRDGKHVNWLPARRAEVKWNFWKRYRQYLEDEKTWPDTVTANLDRITDQILGDIGNPNQGGAWDRRGMVVGEVQSGKTANYTGLICKAVDSGYKLIVVMAGLTNDLRSQTQSRLDEEFLGFESQVGKVHSSGSRIGVGKIDDYGQLIAHPLTYSAKDGDFRANKSANLQLGGTPILLVVKKNGSVLQRILSWAENQGKVHPQTGKRVVDDIPLLLLDDEADNASVNTKTEDDPTTINRGIRQILNAFQKKSYVGYTATPFANIFIPPDEEDRSRYGDDLFPRGFIYYIAPPSNYIGPALLFGLNEDLDGGDNTTEGLDLVRKVEDSEDAFPEGHKKEYQVSELPESLMEAMLAFILTCSARRVRGQKDVHNSMLIHVTRFNMVQKQVMDLVNEELVNLRRTIEYKTGSQAKSLFEKLETLWNEDYLPTFENISKQIKDPEMVPVAWAQVREELLPAVLKIQVRAINGDRDIGGVLDYSNHPSGLNVIAIGGDKLSRGLTLSGLSVSYYTRPSKNYDTLLQMGRWFGYRPGYSDLCRLYTPEDIVSWYEHIAVANEELRREFNFMELSHLTPEDYGLKVRTHPEGLSITAANKIKHGKTMQVCFSGSIAQTTIFHKSRDIQASNFNVTEKWLESLQNPEVGTTGIKWTGVKPSKISEFLDAYAYHPACAQADTEILREYIKKMVSMGELIDWTVVLLSSSRPSATPDKIAGHDVRLIVRRDDKPADRDLYMMKKANILSPEDESMDLSDEQHKQALADTIAAWNPEKSRSKKKPERAGGQFIRQIRSPQNGLLLIYPLDYKETGGVGFADKPIIGFAFSFPASVNGMRGAIEYRVNTKFWRERYGEDDDD